MMGPPLKKKKKKRKEKIKGKGNFREIMAANCDLSM